MKFSKLRFYYRDIAMWIVEFAAVCSTVWIGSLLFTSELPKLTVIIYFIVSAIFTCGMIYDHIETFTRTRKLVLNMRAFRKAKEEKQKLKDSLQVVK